MSSDEGPVCEYCSGPITDEPVVDPDTDYQFCSTGCLHDYQEDKRVGQIEAAREREVWGDDYDSWYR